MRFWSHAAHPFPLPDGHRYPLPKYRLLHDAIAQAGIATSIVTPELVSVERLERAHDPAFVQRMLAGDLDRRETRVLGLPWSPELAARARRGTQGTIEAARDALNGQRVGMMLGGGTHHAGRATARGFCLFNDIAVMLAELRATGEAQRLLVVDCDVHQGDGTAELLGADPDAFTVSLHGARNYPFKKVPSDIDVDLPTGTGDDAYLEALDDVLHEAARQFGTPDLVCYLAGADPWEGDALGRLNLTKAGLLARDELVLDRAIRLTSAVVVTLAGGYPPDVHDGVAINLQTARAASARAVPRPTTPAHGPGLRA